MASPWFLLAQVKSSNSTFGIAQAKGAIVIGRNGAAKIGGHVVGLSSLTTYVVAGSGAAVAAEHCAPRRLLSAVFCQLGVRCSFLVACGCSYQSLV